MDWNQQSSDSVPGILPLNQRVGEGDLTVSYQAIYG